MRHLWLIIVIAVPAIISGCLAQAEPVRGRPAAKDIVNFIREEITLKVSDGLAEVEGVYYFLNNSQKTITFPVIFPFYVDSNSLYPHLVSAYVVKEDEEKMLELERLRSIDGVRLVIPLRPGEVTAWGLNYKQKLLATCARYILTSTSAWRRPLEEATYYFAAPESLAGVRTWPQADTFYTIDKTRIFKAVRLDFMPKKNMEICWGREQE